MPTLVRDLKHAVRQLRARPGFALLAIVSLAIGIGAPSVVFTAVDATLLRRLPVRAPQQLVEVDLSDSIGAAFSSFAYPNVRDLAARTRSLAGMAAWDTDMLSVATDGDPTLAIGEFVTGNYFSVLGTSPQLGRFFAADEDGPSTARAVAVVSDAFWRTRLGADPHAIGRMLSINGVPFTLIGVAAPEVAQVSAILKPDVWTTMGTIPLVAPQMAIERRTYSTFQAIGRLRPGIETTAAARELSALQHGIDAEHPEAGTGRTVRLFPLTSVPAEFRSALLPLFALLDKLRS